MDIRSKILIFLNKLSPVNLNGDLEIKDKSRYELSCIINFYGRTNLLRNILSSLASQQIDKNRFEVVLVEDRGGTEEGALICEEYSEILNINYVTLKEKYGFMGYSRNIGVKESSGKYILFLDDDTVILQNNFLSHLLEVFKKIQPDGIMPLGQPSFCIVGERYQYHDPYYPTNRCMAYSRITLMDLKGFKSNIIGQEDVEFNLRLVLSEKNIISEPGLRYFHPPLIQENFSKSASVGLSYFKLRKSYPFLIWVFIILNGLRYLPLGILSFNNKYFNQFKFSTGFLLGIIYGISGKKADYK